MIRLSQPGQTALISHNYATILSMVLVVVGGLSKWGLHSDPLRRTGFLKQGKTVERR